MNSIFQRRYEYLPALIITLLFYPFNGRVHSLTFQHPSSRRYFPPSSSRRLLRHVPSSRNPYFLPANDYISTLSKQESSQQKASLWMSYHYASIDNIRSAVSPLRASSSSEGDSKSKNIDPSLRKRPEWALDWMPTWLITLTPIQQAMIVLVVYVFHLTVLTQNSLVFPFQLFPSRLGHFASLGYDSIAGIVSLLAYLYLRKTTKNRPTPAVPSLFSSPSPNESPWKFMPMESHLPGPKATGVLALYLLIQGYFMTGRFSVFWEDLLYSMAGVGFPMTVPMHRSLVVLLGHLSWIVVGGLILGLVPRPQPFFGGGFQTNKNEMKDTMTPKQNRWYTSTWKTYWVWWTLGGYFVSSWFFNLADFANQMLLPHALFESANDGIVAQLINPENNEWLASLVGFFAPCISAPWWEEILYRGFMLPAMCLHLPYWPSVWLSGILFSIHHVSATGAIPLMVLGWTWAALYTKCKNLTVTILIHAMWNSRVFLGSWLGL
jgi:membrane protease YdiL (CAAX protease family)